MPPDTLTVAVPDGLEHPVGVLVIDTMLGLAFTTIVALAVTSVQPVGAVTVTV